MYDLYAMYEKYGIEKEGAVVMTGYTATFAAMMYALTM